MALIIPRKPLNLIVNGLYEACYLYIWDVCVHIFTAQINQESTFQNALLIPGLYPHCLFYCK